MKTAEPLYLNSLRGTRKSQSVKSAMAGLLCLVVHASLVNVVAWADTSDTRNVIGTGGSDVDAGIGHSDIGNSELSQPAVNIGEARIRLPLPGQTTAVVYLTLHNASPQNLVVTGVKVPGSDRAELHQHLHENGMMKMRKVEQIPVAAGETLQFAPGGYHIMAFEMETVTSSISAQRVYPITLVFKDGRYASVDAKPIR